MKVNQKVGAENEMLKRQISQIERNLNFKKNA